MVCSLLFLSWNDEQSHRFRLLQTFNSPLTFNCPGYSSRLMIIFGLVDGLV